MPFLLVQDGERFLAFEDPTQVLVATAPGDVLAALASADAALAAGRYVAGYLGYEAAAAFGLTTRPPDPDGPPLLWLGVFAPPREVSPPAAPLAASLPPADWRPGLDAASHAAALARLHALIEAGQTYQVNFTFQFASKLVEQPAELFARLFAVQRPRHAAYLDLGRFAIASASPELFFEREGETLRARPMKGTAARGATPGADEALASALRVSEKERAENLMIVDMMRNDLGRVADLGSVVVETLFDVERYPTLLQMTSSIRARSRAPLSRLFAALFPCASVTGAPKARTMEIVALHESRPRGVYTGTIGWAAPDGRARWNVAIRTAVADRQRGTLVYGAGSGVVADSTAAGEYAECLLKARVLEETPFALVETLAFLPGEGFRRLEGHLARLAASACHFGFRFDGVALERALRETATAAAGNARVRLLLHGDGRVEVQASPLPPPSARPLRVGLAARPVDPANPWLYHKTTRRAVYEEARASRPDCDEALLWNQRGEVTEASVANVILELAGARVTPPVACGLLPGVERARALAEGRAREAVVRLADLRQGAPIWLLSSLRGTREAVFVG